MNEERIIKSIEKMFKETNERIDSTNAEVKSIASKLDKFEDETRTNFVSMSQMLRHTNERITELDKKMEKRFEYNNRELGMLLNSAFESMDKTYVKIKDLA